MNINAEEIIRKGIVTGLVNPEKQIQMNGVDLTVSQTIIIKSKSFINVLFNEKVKIPEKIMAIFNIRSSFSRQGVFSSTGIWDTGYEGVTGCSLYNLSDNDITIEQNERVGQMVFFESDSLKKYNGVYLNNQNIHTQNKEDLSNENKQHK